MSPPSKQALTAGMAALVAAAIAVVWLARGPDAAEEVDAANRIEPLSCEDPKWVNDPSCAARACRRVLEARNAVPPGHELIVAHAAGDKNIRVEGYIQGTDPTAVAASRKPFKCTVVGGKVAVLEVDGTTLLMNTKGNEF